MKRVVSTYMIGALALLFSAQLCRGQSETAQILDYVNENDGTGPYKYSFKTSDGIEREEEGFLVDGNLVVRGSYSYIGADGKKYSVSYTADENGYQPMMEEPTERPIVVSTTPIYPPPSRTPPPFLPPPKKSLSGEIPSLSLLMAIKPSERVQKELDRQFGKRSIMKFLREIYPLENNNHLNEFLEKITVFDHSK